MEKWWLQMVIIVYVPFIFMMRMPSFPVKFPSSDLRMKIDTNDLSVKLGEYGYQIIRKNYRKLIDQEKIFLTEKRSEALHQMRVG